MEDILFSLGWEVVAIGISCSYPEHGKRSIMVRRVVEFPGVPYSKKDPDLLYTTGGCLAPIQRALDAETTVDETMLR
jgi:hypothetical protein